MEAPILRPTDPGCLLGTRPCEMSHWTVNKQNHLYHAIDSIQYGEELRPWTGVVALEDFLDFVVVGL